MRATLRLFTTVGAAFALATAVRYGLVERDDLGPACAAADAAWPCHLRMLFIHGFVHGVYGYASLACAGLAAWWRAPWLAHAGLVVGTFGMVLYDFAWSGAGVVAAALVLARQQHQWPEHAEPEQQAA